jgi:hypothetical protein
MIRRIVNGLVLVVLLVAAGFVIHSTPSDAERDAPIYVTGAIGDHLAGRNIGATVTDVRLADVVSTESWSGETAGVWVVVDVSAEAVETETAALLNVSLVIGDRTYSASTRPGLDTIANQALSVGIPIGGPVMFEVPADALTADAKVRISQSSDPRGDSVLEIPVDLSSLDIEPTLATEPTTVGEQ